MAIDGRGRISHLRDAEAAFRREHEREWGKLGLESATLLHGLAPNEPVDALAWYDRDAASMEEIEAIVQRIDPAASVRLAPDRILLTATRAEIVRLAQAPFVTHVVASREVPRQALAPDSATDSVTWSVSPPYIPPYYTATPGFNQYGFYGEGVSVGMIEGRENCGIWYDSNNSSNHHEAFGELGTMKHLNDNLACGSDCQIRCRSTAPWQGSFEGECHGGICVEPHGHWVASRIAYADQNEPYHAGRVNLFFANVGDNNTGGGGIAYNEVDAEEAAEWFLEQDPPARIINRSVGSSHYLIKEEVLEDWLARYYGMTYVIGSGNADSETGPWESHCNNLNTICVGASSRNGGSVGPVNNNKSYLNYHHQRVWDLSDWENPAGLEVEKPDLVALGHNVDVAAHDDVAATGGSASGTSFAAPVVVGYLALLTEYCFGGVNPTPLLYRVLLRTAAWSPHSFDTDSDPDTPCPASVGMNPLFPTAAYGCDYKAGVGSLDTRHLMIFCGNNSGCGNEPDEPCMEFGEDTDVEADDPRWGSAGDYPDLETADPEEFINNAFALTRDDTGFRPLPLHRWDTLDEGTRLRAAFAYNSCPTRPSGGTWTSAASVNFDLALCGKKASNSESLCVFVSESLHDTNEGFDVRIPVDLYDVDLIVIGPRDNDDPDYWPECSDGAGRSSRAESWSWSAVWWGPGVWP